MEKSVQIYGVEIELYIVKKLYIVAARLQKQKKDVGLCKCLKRIGKRAKRPNTTLCVEDLGYSHRVRS